MNYLVSQIVNFITKQDVISDEADVQDFYRYGIEISISSLFETFDDIGTVILEIVCDGNNFLNYTTKKWVFFYYILKNENI